MECLLPALQETSNNKLITYHLFLHFTPLHSFCPDCLSVETLIVTVAQWQPSHAESWHLDRWGQRKKNFFTCQCSQRQSQQPATGRHLRHEQIVVEWQQSRCSDVNAAYVRKCVWVSGEEIVCGCLLASVVLSLSFSLSSYLSLLLLLLLLLCHHSLSPLPADLWYESCAVALTSQKRFFCFLT